MKVIYRGPCDELYGREMEFPDHDCTEHAERREADHVETHGFDCGPYEHWHEEWWECSICAQLIDESDFKDAGHEPAPSGKQAA